MRPVAPLSKRKHRSGYVRNPTGRGQLPNHKRKEEHPMRKVLPPLFDQIVRPLRTQYDEIVQEPVPKRWVELINYLNEKDQKRREGLRRRPGSEISN